MIYKCIIYNTNSLLSEIHTRRQSSIGLDMANCYAEPFWLLDHLWLLGLVSVSITISKKTYKIQGMRIYIYMILVDKNTFIFYVKIINNHNICYVDES